MRGKIHLLRALPWIIVGLAVIVLFAPAILLALDAPSPETAIRTVRAQVHAAQIASLATLAGGSLLFARAKEPASRALVAVGVLVALAAALPLHDESRTHEIDARYSQRGFHAIENATSSFEGIDVGRITPVFVAERRAPAEGPARSPLLVPMPFLAKGDVWYVTAGIPDSPERLGALNLTFSGAECTILESDAPLVSQALDMRCIATGEEATIGHLAWDDAVARNPYYQIWLVPTYSDLYWAKLDESLIALGLCACASAGLVAALSRRENGRGPIPALATAGMLLVLGVPPFLDVQNRPWAPQAGGPDLAYVALIAIIIASFAAALGYHVWREGTLSRESALVKWVFLLATPAIGLMVLLPNDGQPVLLAIAKGILALAALAAAARTYLAHPGRTTRS